MTKYLVFLIFVFSFVSCEVNSQRSGEPLVILKKNKSVFPGAYSMNDYLSQLKNKSVGVLVNQTSLIGTTHLVDTLLSNGIFVKKIFSPEHGFRGKDDAGAKIDNNIDVKTGIPIISLYGKHKKPTLDDLKGIEVMIFDVQDVGARFYTYISTLHLLMEACAENSIALLILDRPNPNGNYIDGPVLDDNLKSFVGMHNIPIVHGLTVGELANMINGEGWLENGIKCDIEIIKCKNYTHHSKWNIEVKPSPNLPNMKSIYLYPSLCLLEGTCISIGRGTSKQFQICGHPDFTEGDYFFTPKPNEGAKYPKLNGKECRGFDFSVSTENDLFNMKRIDLSYLINAYRLTKDKSKFFLKSFDRLVGTKKMKQQIIDGLSEEEIKMSWQDKLNEYKKKRLQYLIYPD